MVLSKSLETCISDTEKAPVGCLYLRRTCQDTPQLDQLRRVGDHVRQATIQGRHLFVIASQSGLVATARKALYQPLAVTLRLGPRPLQQAADARLLEQRRNRRNAAIGSFTQAGHLQLQITGKTAQFIGEHAETERRLPGALGKKIAFIAIRLILKAVDTTLLISSLMRTMRRNSRPASDELCVLVMTTRYLPWSAGSRTFQPGSARRFAASRL